MRWGSLKNRREREILLEKMNVVGSGDIDCRDYIAIFVKRTEKTDFFLIKYGVRTIYEKSWDEEWYDVYNWNIILFAREKPDGDYIQIDQEEFLTYDEAEKILERFMNEYPAKYYRDEDGEEIEFPDWAKFIVSKALQELTSDNVDEVKSKISSTALAVRPKLLRKAYELIDMEAKILSRP